FNTIFLKYSPEAEVDANALAAQILALAGYDSREMTNFFQALQRRARGDAPKLRMFLDDHPIDHPGDQLAGDNRVEQKDRQAAGRRGPQLAGGDFQRIQTYVAGLPRVTGPAPVTRRGPTVMEEVESDRPATNLRVERPSSHSRDYWQPGGVWFQVAYPENWRAYPSGDKLGVTFIPPGGGLGARGQTRLIYGAGSNHYRLIGDNSLWTGLRRRSFRYIGGRGELVEATNDLLDSLLQNNPHLDFARGSDRRGSSNGLPAITLTLIGRSPLTGRGERVQLYTRELDDGDVVYAVFVAPEDEYGDFRPTFERMLRGLKIDDGALQRRRRFDQNSFDFDSAPALLALRRGHGDFEHAVAEGGFRLVRVDPFGQWNAAEETAVAAFAAIPAFPLLFVFMLALSLNRERVVGNFHLHVVTGHTWQVGPHDELAAAFKTFDLRRPLGATDFAPDATEAEVFEQALDLISEAVHQSRFVARQALSPLVHLFFSPRFRTLLSFRHDFSLL